MFKESGLVVLNREGDFLLDVAQRAGQRLCQSLKGTTGGLWLIIM